MGFISILIALFGGYILWYGLDLPPVTLFMRQS